MGAQDAATVEQPPLECLREARGDDRIRRFHQRQRPHPRMEVIEQRIGVADVAGARAARDQHGLAGAQRQYLELDALEAATGQRCKQGRRRLRVLTWPCTRAEVQPTLSLGAGAQGEVKHGFADRRLLPDAERFDRGTPRKRQLAAAEQRPVCMLTGRGTPGPEGDMDAADAACRERIELWRARGLAGRAIAQFGAGSIAEAIEDDQQDRQSIVVHVRLRCHCSSRSRAPGGTQCCQGSAFCIALRMSLAERRVAGSPSSTCGG